jgi:ABC-type transport system involved in multi-copper enzyme maturation permease subunit
VRLREVFRYELAYRLRSGSTWAYAAFLFLMMCWGVAATAGDVGSAVLTNAPYEVAERTVLFGGLFGLLVSAALFGDAAIRDVASGMDALLYTTRLRRTEYLGGRYLAALAVNAVVVLAIPLGFFAATRTFVDADALGPFRLAAYLQPLLLFLLPNLVLVGAVLFGIGTLTRQAIPVYLGAVAVFITYIVAANYWTGIESPLVSVLADPLGINALQAMTRYWTPVERNARLVGFPTLLLWNRVLWLAIASGVFALLHHRFRFAHVGGGGGRDRSRAALDTPSPSRGPVDVPQVAGVFGRRTRLRQTLAVARRSLAEVASGRAFQVALVGAVGLVLLWGWNVGETAFDTPSWPVAHLVVAKVLSERSIIVPWLVIALYAGELVWKDREVGAAEIADAVPVPTAIALSGRFLALVAIVVAFHAAFMVGGLLLQTLQGYYRFELGLYLRVLFGLNLLNDVLLAAMAMAVHVLVNQKYVGHIIVLGACVLAMVAGPLGLPYLAVYGSGPRWTYSDMNGFGPFLRSVLWFKLYWAAWALLLAVATRLLWVRGRESGLRRRIALARARLHGSTARAAGAALALVAALGGFVHYETSILNDDPRRDDAGRPRAEYERRYARFLNAPQPQVTAADLRVELHPDQPAADMRGGYRLVNRTAVAIDSIHVVVDREIATRSISFDRAARPVVVDDEHGYRIFALARPLAPGDSLRLSFDVAFRPHGFRTGDVPTEVVGNGSFFNSGWLPFVGYQPLFELSDATARKRLALAPRPSTPSPDDAEARQHDGIVRNEAPRVHVDAIVGTSADQIAVVTAALRRSWTEGGRRYFQYATEMPGPFGTAVFSARYAVREDRWRDVALQVLHHPEHRYDVARMIESMKASLDYYTRTFGPYPWRELRVVEIPPYSINGRAHATTIAFSEQNFITRNAPGRVDHTFFGTAHEVAHSWWGGQLRGAYVRGGAVLSETLSNYSAMMLTETVLGPEEARRVYDFQMDRYLSRRAAFPRDVPLIDVEDHPHISYGKGAVAMYTLREHLGAETVNGVLRRFLEKHRGGGPPYPTSRDLVAELRAVTPDSLQYLLTDLFETVTLWDVKTQRATVRRTGTGAYEVTLDVVAKKLRADSVGREREVPMNDLIEIGVFAPGGERSLREPLYLQRHRIHGGRQTIVVTVPRSPARAGIDPFHKLIDRDRENDVVAVVAAGGGAGGR